jgi:fibronectin-binding autotransporter adhesin
MLIPEYSRAQSTWTGLGANNNWSTSDNWNTAPNFPTALTFAGSTQLDNSNDLAGITVNGITFDAAAGAFVLNGNDITLSGNFGFNGNPATPVTQTVNLNTTLSAGETIDTPANGNLTLGGDLTSSVDTSLIKLDSGALTLGGTNAILSWDLNGGTTILTGNTTINGDGSGRIYVADGDYLADCNATLDIQPGAVLNITGTYGDTFVIGRDSGSGTVNQNGGTFTFNPANNGTIWLGATGNGATRSAYNMNGGLLDMNGNTLGIGLGAGVLITGLVNQVSGVITNVGNLWVGWGNGHGVYSLSGGSIYIGASGVTTTSGSYEVDLGGGTVGAEVNWASALNMNLTGSNGPVTFNPAGNTITLSGVLSGNGGLAVAGGGTLELSGANTYTGDTVVNVSSILQLDVTGSSVGAFRLANGASLNLNFSGTYAVAGFYTNGVALQVGTYNAGNLPAFITGSGSLQVSSGISTGIWTGGGANNDWSTTGNWNNNAVPVFPIGLTFAGSTGLVNNNDLSSITVSGITFDAAAGAFVLNGDGITLSGNIGFNGNPATPVTQTVNLNMGWSVNETIDTPTNGNLTLGGDITSGDDLTKLDSGTLTLGGTNTIESMDVNGGTNTITGNTILNGNNSSGNYDRFYIGDGDSVANCNGTLIIQNGATFTVTGSFNDTLVIGRDGGSGTVIQNGGTFTFNPANVSLMLVCATGNSNTRAEYDMNGGLLDMSGNTLVVGFGAGVVTTGIVNQVGGVITNLYNLAFYTPSLPSGSGHGVYTLSGGSIYIGASGITTSSGTYAINLGGGTVGAEASWSSSLNMNLTNLNGSVTFNPAGNTITLSGVLSGDGGLAVAGGGTLELSGANTYTGDTVVDADSTLQLDVTGSSLGAFRLANGALLNLNFSGTYAVAGFYTNGVALPVGTYNAGNLPGFITGNGSLQVSSGISTGIWTGNGTNNDWSAAGNWNNNAVPIFPIGLTFAGSTRLDSSNDLTGITVNGITFDVAAGAFVLDGNDITLSGNFGFNGDPATPVTQTFNLNTTLSASEIVDTPDNGNLTLGGDLTSSVDTSLIKLDSGTLTLGGTNAILSWDLNGGITTITGNTTINGDGNGRIYVADGDYLADCTATLDIQPGAELNITGTYGDTFVIGRDGGSGTVNQNGGTFTFNPGNNGTIWLGATGNSATRSAYNMNGGLLDMNGNTLGIGLGAGVLITGLVNQVSGVITNVGNLWVGWGNGHGVYSLNGGSIYIGASGVTTTSGNYAVNLGGGTVGAEVNWASALNMNLTGSNGPVTFNPAGNTITLSGVLSGNGGLTVAGGGTLELSGANTYTGDTVVNASSILQLDVTGSSVGAFRLGNGALLNLNFSGTYAVAGFYTNGVALQVGTYNASNLPAFITGGGSLQVVGTIPTTPTNLSYSVSGGKLTINWPANYQGWILQQQTNTLNVGLSTNWVDVAGSANVTSTNLPINPANPVIFYRLRYPSP